MPKRLTSLDTSPRHLPRPPADWRRPRRRQLATHVAELLYDAHDLAALARLVQRDLSVDEHHYVTAELLRRAIAQVHAAHTIESLLLPE